jgi:hypothetical protein
MKNPKYLYHGSAEKLKFLTPQRPEGKNDSKSCVKGIYATSDKKFALAISACRSSKAVHAFNNRNTHVQNIYKGWPNENAIVYLYILDSKDFSHNSGSEWIAKKKVTPIKIEKHKVKDLAHLYRKSNKKELNEWLKNRDDWICPDNITTEIIKNKNLTNYQKGVINKARISNWGKGAKKNFQKDYEQNTLWIFVKIGKRIVSLGGIRPIKVKLNKKIYSIGGICSTISIEKGKGYGKIMVREMLDYSRKTGKTILGFTADKNVPIFRKSGLKAESGIIEKFVWIKKDGTKEYDDDGIGIFAEGKDKFISRLKKCKNMAEIKVEFW